MDWSVLGISPVSQYGADVIVYFVNVDRVIAEMMNQCHF